MLQVERIHPALLTDRPLEAAVVIDVLRATSTAIALLARGVTRIRIVATPEALAGLERRPGDGTLVFSELEASRGSGFECVDNSPALAEEIELAGRQPVLVTTNGTRAVAAAVARASRVYLASFGNLSATTSHLVQSATRVAILPAGDFAGGEPRTEDERCADALDAMLRGAGPDLATLVAECRADARVQRRIARHPELIRDVDVALAVDRHPVVARVEADAGSGRLELIPVPPPYGSAGGSKVSV